MYKIKQKIKMETIWTGSYLERMSHALRYYHKKGYKNVEKITPWTVYEDISDITKHEDRRNFYFKNDVIVASGEQSFLQMIKDSGIKPGKYSTYTPCFRDEDYIDDIHKQYFLKVELIEWWYDDSNGSNHTENVEKLDETIKICKDFYSQYMQPDVIKTEDGFDIVDKITGIEIGSYGIRSCIMHNKKITWIYATGLAEPRFTHILEKSQPGYHINHIPKSKIGSLDKISEELMECFDAEQQNNKIMLLVELSDLYGALESFMQSNFPTLSIDDLKNMSQTTKRAFISGRR